jgi:muramoyltetrapeptide carboxypeptidase
MQNIKMPLLELGSKIGIVAPARKVSEDEIQPFIKWVQKQGWVAVLGANLFGNCHQFSGTDAERLSDFNQMLRDDEIKAIFFARGGYGSVRIVDNIDWQALIQNPKWLCGYSDMTVFHQHVAANFVVPTLHCHMPISFLQYQEKAFETALELTSHLLVNGNVAYALPKEYEGVFIESLPVYGGNLSVLYSLLGSKSLHYPSQDYILLLEDLDEFLYHIDRMMIALKRAGYFARVKAVLIGGMTDMKDNAIPFGKNALSIVSDCMEDLGVPVYSNFPAGHIAANFPVPFGLHATIQDNSIKFASF